MRKSAFAGGFCAALAVVTVLQAAASASGSATRLFEAGEAYFRHERLPRALQSWEAALESVTAQGGQAYAIPAGASDHPLGGLGFARWAGRRLICFVGLGLRSRSPRTGLDHLNWLTSR